MLITSAGNQLHDFVILFPTWSHFAIEVSNYLHETNVVSLDFFFPSCFFLLCKISFLLFDVKFLKGSNEGSHFILSVPERIK